MWLMGGRRHKKHSTFRGAEGGRTGVVANQLSDVANLGLVRAADSVSYLNRAQVACFSAVANARTS